MDHSIYVWPNIVWGILFCLLPNSVLRCVYISVPSLVVRAWTVRRVWDYMIPPSPVIFKCSWVTFPHPHNSTNVEIMFHGEELSFSYHLLSREFVLFCITLSYSDMIAKWINFEKNTYKMKLNHLVSFSTFSDSLLKYGSLTLCNPEVHYKLIWKLGSLRVVRLLYLPPELTMWCHFEPQNEVISLGGFELKREGGLGGWCQGSVTFFLLTAGSLENRADGVSFKLHQGTLD